MGTEPERAYATPLSPDEVLQLWVAMLCDDVQPAELLAARCAAPDGRSWSESVLGPALDAPRPLSEWSSLKSEGKRGFQRAELERGDAAAIGAFLRYTAAIGGALHDHGELLTRMDTSQIARMLDMVGPLLPEGWSRIFASARARLGASPLKRCIPS
ncbi:MAG: hypothetical protein EXS03_04925 [Phycisphaerales bacterium]|nr:hypothetical protein [Phycisphaerales bacterium]